MPITPEQAIQLKDSALETLETDPRSTIQSCTRIIENYPDAETHILRAEAHSAMENYLNAKEDYDSALDFDKLVSKEKANIYASRACIKEMIGDYRGAIDDYQESINLEPSPAAYRSRGLLLMSVELYVDALSDFHNAVKLGSGEDAVEMFYNRANAYRALGEFQKASDDLSKVLGEYHAVDTVTESSALAQRGILYANQGLSLEAFIDVSLALEHIPEDINLRILRCRLALKIGQYRVALYDANLILRILRCRLALKIEQYRVALYDANLILRNQLHAEAYSMRSLAKRHLGYAAEADKDQESAMRLQDPQLASLLAEGLVKFEENSFEAAADFQTVAKQAEIFTIEGIGKLHHKNSASAAAAIADFSIVMDIMNGNALEDIFKDSIYKLRGIAKIRIGRFMSAVRDFDTAIEHDDESATNYGLRSLAYASLGENANALKDVSAAIERKNVTAGCLANLYLLRGKIRTDLNEEARTDYDKARELNKDLKHYYTKFYARRTYSQFLKPIVREEIGTAEYIDRKKKVVTIHDLTIVINSEAQNINAYYERGWAYLKTEAIDAAISDFNTVIKKAPTWAEAYYARGKAHAAADAPEAGIKDFTTAIELKPSFAEPYYQRGLINSKLDKLDQAINDYSAAIARKPNFTHALYSRAILYYENKDYNQAIDDATRTIELLTPESKLYALVYHLRAGAYYAKSRALGDIEYMYKSISDSIKRSNSLSQSAIIPKENE